MTCDGDVYTKAIRQQNAVHSLEHGAVWVTYNGKAADADVKALAEKVAKTPYTLMSPVEDQAGPDHAAARGASSAPWTRRPTRVEQVPQSYVQGEQTPEPGAACTGGLSK